MHIGESANKKNPLMGRNKDGKEVEEENGWTVVFLISLSFLFQIACSKQIVPSIWFNESYQWWAPLYPLKCCFWERLWIVLRDTTSLSSFHSRLRIFFLLLRRLYPIVSSLKCAYCFYQVFLFLWMRVSAPFHLTGRLIAVLLRSNWIIWWFYSIEPSSICRNDLCHFIGFQTHMHIPLAMQISACIRRDVSFSPLRLGTLSTRGWHIGNARVMFSNSIYWM